MYSLDFIKACVKSHSISKNIFLSSLIIFLFSAIYFVSSWGQTKVSVIRPHQLMHMWAANKIPFSDEGRKAALNKLQTAVDSNSNDPLHYYYLAALYDLHAYQNPIFDDDAIIPRTKAITLYKQALKLRPTWAAAWANLAMSKTLNLEFGDDVKMALSNAMLYGVWENSVFHKVLWISLANWNGLPVSLQQQVIARVRETVTPEGRVPKYIQQTAMHFNWQENLKEVIKQVLSQEKKVLSH